MRIFLRSETYENEFRTPIVPADVIRLMQHGATVLVEASLQRIFSDAEYGASITIEKWYEQGPDTLIIGLKELDHLDKLNDHSHVYFSHSYKGQANADKILRAFARSNSRLYDLEYFLNDSKRAIAFGFYAGMVGAALGLRQYFNRVAGFADITDLTPWDSKREMLRFCRVVDCSIAIIGNGRCSAGARYLLDKFKIAYSVLTRSDKIDLSGYDLVINCITLDPSYTETWITDQQNSWKLLIVDVSCDYAKPNNPIAIYNKGTSWASPVFNYGPNISVIAVDNLPSLLPRESSIEFSRTLVDILLAYGDQMWADNLAMFRTLTR